MPAFSNPSLVFFGGSFDPPHQGHLDCVAHAQKRFPKAKIFILPSFQAPLDKEAVKVTKAPFEDRVAMCRLAFSKLLPSSQVLELERELPAPNYTVQTLKHLKNLHPSEELSWLLGLDQLFNFSNWKEPLEILGLASLIILGRESQSFNDAISIVEKNLSLTSSVKINDVVYYPNMKPLYFLDSPTTSTASHIIREKTKESLRIPETWISSEVNQYIHKHQLYRGIL